MAPLKKCFKAKPETFYSDCGKKSVDCWEYYFEHQDGRGAK